MFGIMIVDDEIRALQYIRNIADFEAYGFKIVCEARSGQEGIVKYMQYKPDLVIADIVMPVMNGLDMADEILKLNPGCLFLLLTSYNEFEYAQKAIKLEVKSYILKHELDEAVMGRELVRISGIIRERVFREELLKWEAFDELSHFDDSASSTEIAQAAVSRFEKWRLPFENGRTFLLVFRLEPPAELDGFRKNYEDFKNLLNSMEEGSGTRCALLTLKPEKAVLLVVLPAGSSYAKRDYLLLTVCSELLGFIREKLSMDAYAGVSGALGSRRDLKPAYSDASEAVRTRFFKRKNELFFYDRLRITDSSFNARRDMLIASLREALENRRYEEAEESLKQLLLDIHAVMSDMEKYNADIDLVTEAFSRIRDFNAARIYKKISNCRYIEEVYSGFCDILGKLADAGQNNYSPKTSAVLDFIDRNLKRNLTLNDIAEHIGISPVYVCQILRKELGVNFKTYLNDKRIKKAEELLRTQKYKTYEVAEMVGYQSVQHFCSTFKKLTGRSPGHYY